MLKQDNKKNGKLQIAPLKFRVVWILHLKILEIWFYTLKFGSISNSYPSVSFAINWHITMLTYFIFAKSTQKLWKIMVDLAQ